MLLPLGEFRRQIVDNGLKKKNHLRGLNHWEASPFQMLNPIMLPSSWLLQWSPISLLLANYYTLQKAVLGPHLSDVSCVLISSLNLVMTALGALSSCANITVFFGASLSRHFAASQTPNIPVQDKNLLPWLSSNFPCFPLITLVCEGPDAAALLGWGLGITLYKRSAGGWHLTAHFPSPWVHRTENSIGQCPADVPGSLPSIVAQHW